MTGNKLPQVQEEARAHQAIHGTQAQGAGSSAGMPSGMPHRELTFDDVFPKPPPHVGKIQQPDVLSPEMPPAFNIPRMFVVRGIDGIPAATFPATTQV
jgi:hypothetical protein